MNDEWLQRSDQAVRKWKRCQKEAVKLFEDEYQYLTHDNSSVQDRAISEMLYIQKTGDYPYDDVQRVVKYLNRQAHICSQMNPDVLPDKSPIILLLHEKMANAWERGEPVSVTTVVREEVLERCVFHMTDEELQKL